MNESLKVKTDNAEITTEKEPASNIEIVVCILLGILSLVCGILMRITVNKSYILESRCNREWTPSAILKICELYSWVGIWSFIFCLYCGFCLIRYNKELIKENNSENKEQE